MAPAPATAVLVLDDLQVVDDPRVLRHLDVLLRDCPGRLRLLLITREEPAVSLHRLRAAGELTEIAASDLAFCPAEAAKLRALGERGSDDDLARSNGRPRGGWSVCGS